MPSWEASLALEGEQKAKAGREKEENMKTGKRETGGKRKRRESETKHSKNRTRTSQELC